MIERLEFAVGASPLNDSSNSAASNRLDRMRARLTQELHASAIELVDDSHLHAGHAGARDGRGHYRVRVIAAAFAGLRPLQRHQLVYKALGDMMQTDIHALNIVALTPDEAH